MDGKLLAQGLLNAKGDELRLVYALIVETKMLDMLVARAKDTFNKEINHLEQDLQNSIEALRNIPDEELQVKLFLHMLELLNIKGAHYNIQTEVEYACQQIVQKSYDLQRSQDKEFAAYTVGRTEEKAIQLVLYQMQKIFKSFDEIIGDLSEEDTESFVLQIEQFIHSLPGDKQRQIKEKLNIDNVTSKTIRQLVTTQGTVIVMIIIVEVAGFAAFTALTSFIATMTGLFGITLPFGFYIFATSALSVITGPLAIVGAIIGGGALLKWQNDKVKKMLLPVGVVQLLLPVVMEGEGDVQAEPFIRYWKTIHEQQLGLQALFADAVTEYTSLNEQIKKVEDEISYLHTSINIARDKKVTAYEEVKKLLPTIKQTEYSLTAIKLLKELTHMTAEMSEKEDEIINNSNVKGFFNKVQNSVLNLQLKSNIKSTQKQYEVTEQIMLEELVNCSPLAIADISISIKKLEDEMSVYEAELKQNREKLGSLSMLRSQTNDQLNEYKKALKNLQKKVYGLKDIE